MGKGSEFAHWDLLVYQTHIYFAIFSISLTSGKSAMASEFALFS